MSASPLEQVDSTDLRSVVALHEELREAILAHREPAGAFAAVTALAVQRVPGAELASVTRGAGADFESVAPTDDLAASADRLQYRLGAGPCLDAATGGTVATSGDLAGDGRWGPSGPRLAGELGLTSVLAVHLFVDRNDRCTALTLYARAAEAFDQGSRLVATVLAAHAATGLVAVAERARADHLQKALESNRQIGAATGILMAQFTVTQQHAFDLLRTASQHSHRKLIDVAGQVVDTGTLPVDQVQP